VVTTRFLDQLIRTRRWQGGVHQPKVHRHERRAVSLRPQADRLAYFEVHRRNDRQREAQDQEAEHGRRNSVTPRNACRGTAIAADGAPARKRELGPEQRVLRNGMLGVSAAGIVTDTTMRERHQSCWRRGRGLRTWWDCALLTNIASTNIVFDRNDGVVWQEV